MSARPRALHTTSHKQLEDKRRFADPGLGVLGYSASAKEGMYQPALDVSLPEEQRAAAFDAWIGGYYAHGNTLDSLASTPLADPPSTVTTPTPETAASASRVSHCFLSEKTGKADSMSVIRARRSGERG